MLKEYLFPLGYGLTGQNQAPAAALGDGSFNFLFDDEGYLVNYSGSTDLFVREDDPPAYRADPPPLTAITRMAVFRDIRNVEHIVFVQVDTLYEVQGNGYRKLYKFLGRSVTNGYYPDLVVHESKLIIINFGDPVLVWNGLTGVVPLGVQETPLPPEVWSGAVPLADNSTYGYGISHAYGAWAYRPYWWTGKTPVSGPCLNMAANGTDKAWGLYELVVQFVDEYGNKGAVSPPSRAMLVRPIVTVSSPANVPANEYTDTPEWDNPSFLMGDCYPPLLDPHIYGVIWGRTLSLNDDGGAGARGVYFEEITYEGTACSRVTCVKLDSILAASNQIDTEVRGPPTASFGWSWKQRTFLAGLEDPCEVWWSDKIYFGQFRLKNVWRLRDHFRAGVPLGDRLVLISRSSVETLYELQDGNLGILEQNFGQGSTYGRSFIDVGGAIFGLWNDGFGFYDGAQHTFVEAPYYIKNLYLDERLTVNSAIKWGDYYVLSVRKDAVSTDNNYLVLYHMRRKAWFLLKETAHDLAVWKGLLIGTDDTINALHKGEPTEAKIVLQGVMPPESSPLGRRNLGSIRFFMEPSSIEETTLVARSDLTLDVDRVGAHHTMPSNLLGQSGNNPVGYWDELVAYATEPYWSSPRDVWVPFPADNIVPGYTHTLEFTFPAGHKVRLKGVALGFGGEQLNL